VAFFTAGDIFAPRLSVPGRSNATTTGGRDCGFPLDGDSTATLAIVKLQIQSGTVIKSASVALKKIDLGSGSKNGVARFRACGEGGSRGGVDKGYFIFLADTNNDWRCVWEFTVLISDAPRVNAASSPSRQHQEARLPRATPMRHHHQC
jgi:hypothetical protein